MTYTGLSQWSSLKYPLVHVTSLLGESPSIGQRGLKRVLVTGNTTWYRERLTRHIGNDVLAANPVASSGHAEPSQRAERGGPAVYCWLKVRTNPMGNHAHTARPDRLICMGADRHNIGLPALAHIQLLVLVTIAYVLNTVSSILSRSTV